MSSTQPTPSRRERLRQATLAEIKERALAQVAGGGPEALSLSAIARAMQLSGPALYRYYASREALLAELVADTYADLADTVSGAGDAAADAPAAERLRTLAAAYRDWALAHPHRYRLLFGTVSGSGPVDPERTLPVAHRSMLPFLAVLADLPAPAGPPAPAALERQLARWARGRAATAGLAPAVLCRGLVAWTRLHGVVSLELAGVFASLGVDPAPVYAAEVEELIP